ncbi:MAG: DUF1292 domain-containing protein [Maledivibacter sp.]|jgi:uncharacterized protein YrzB (UPF0473 family)|nr:DUF1292 domain-containing protein [Maledivibacter sp.]
MNKEKNHNCNCGHDHQHDEKHGCGCQGNHQHDEEHECECGGSCSGHSHEDVEMIYLTLGDGEELACQVLAVFEVGEKEYIALLPQGQEDVYLYGYKETEEGPMLSQIEEDKEYAMVSEAFLSFCE